MVSLLDKSWMMKGKATREYFQGCKDFVEFAWANKPAEYGTKIYCPCVRCNNQLFKRKDEVLDHIRRVGILRNYSCWTKHGESEVVNLIANDGDDMHGMLRDAFTAHSSVEEDSRVLDEPNVDEYHSNICISDEPNKDAQTFFKYLKEAETPLFPGSTKSTKLSFFVRLLLDKCINGWSNKSFDMLLKTLTDSLPDDLNMPKNYYEAKKLLKNLGMECIKIDACPNDCMLYWKDDIDKEECDICGESRWKPETCQSNENEVVLQKKTKKKASKVLRYFPLKPRLQRLYMCSKTSKDMRWHDEGRTKDGKLRHPADTKAWEALDMKYPWFAADPRNVRLGLASDGFNPFGTLSTTHSTWPIVLIPYNLPPWLCMKQTHFIMSTLIPGPSSPGNNIDVYLQPLIEELKELWFNGIETYDAHLKQNFQMHAAVLWTINDFPAFANLSGWSTKGSLTCPRCHKYTCSERLHHGNKFCYMGHRRFLPHGHKFRKNTTSFNGKIETGHAPIPLIGTDVLEELRGHDQVTFGKAEHDKFGRKRKQR